MALVIWFAVPVSCPVRSLHVCWQLPGRAAEDLMFRRGELGSNRLSCGWFDTSHAGRMRLLIDECYWAALSGLHVRCRLRRKHMGLCFFTAAGIEGTMAAGCNWLGRHREGKRCIHTSRQQICRAALRGLNGLHACGTEHHGSSV